MTVSHRDLIYIRELNIRTIIGVHPHERITPQSIIVDVEMAVNMATAIDSDAIEHALDYDRVARRITETGEHSRFQLLESLADAIAGMLQTEFGITWLRLRIAKPGALPNAREAGVIIERCAEH